MKRFIIALGSLAMAACATLPSSPVALANRTTADERIATPAELAYKSWRLAVDIAIDSKKLTPGSSKAIKIADIDNQLYTAVQLVRATYNVPNSSDYKQAIDRANALLTTGYNLLRSK